jgi:alkylation response protein AidB-like acyl-CoA dehydrogenase
MIVRMTDDERAMVEACDEFGKKVLEPWVKRVENGENPKEVLVAMANLGLLGLAAPEEYGGLGGSWRMLALAIEKLAEYNEALCEYIYMSNCNFIFPFLKYCTEEQKQNWLPGIISGETLGAMVLTEPDAGSDNNAMTTTAAPDGDCYVINGQKCFITDAENADFYLTFVVTSPKNAPKKEISAFVIFKDQSSGVTIGKAENIMGMRGAPVFSMYFDDCRVPRENLVGNLGDGFKVAMWGLNGGRVSVAAMTVGIAQHAINIAVNYALNRKMFGKTLADFQNTQFVLAECQAKVDAAFLMTLEAGNSLDIGNEDFLLCSEVKMFAPEVANEVVYKCSQLLGGYGYTTDYPMERLYRNVRITTIFEGATEVQKHTVARLMGLRGPKKQ